MPSVDARLTKEGGFWVWRAAEGDARVLFAGKGPTLGRRDAMRHLLPPGVEPAWLRQIHSRRVLAARPGDSGEGDALVTSETGLALCVVTADCVPVLFTAPGRLAAAHAGWRGLASRILPATLKELNGAGRGLTAWIGPTIGPCCYEVGPEVAAEVAAASHDEVVRPGPRGRPHLHLQEAAAAQLRELGVEDIRRVAICTRCAVDRLWSYRRDGRDAGRNLSLVWRAAPPGSEAEGPPAEAARVAAG